MQPGKRRWRIDATRKKEIEQICNPEKGDGEIINQEMGY